MIESIKYALKPIMKFIEDKDVIEIILNDNGTLFIEKQGKEMYEVDNPLHENAIEQLAMLLPSSNGKYIDHSITTTMPKYDLRVQIFYPPVVERIAFIMRRPATKIYTLDNYVETGILSKKQKEDLQHSIEKKHNIVIAGGTGSGKTTFTNAMLNELYEIYPNERLYIIEDIKELQVRHKNVTRILSVSNFSYQDAVRASLRARPDRIMFGESRDGQATLELLKAWNTGHSGGFTTIHANSAAETIERLDQLISEVTIGSQKNLVMQSVDLVVFIKNTKGKRFIDEFFYTKRKTN